MPIFIPVDIMEDVIKLVAQKISGNSGPVGTDSKYLQEWILKFSKDSKNFVLVLKCLLTDKPIRIRPGHPIVNLCLYT